MAHPAAGRAAAAAADATVDVLITTYDEPVALVMATARRPWRSAIRTAPGSWTTAAARPPGGGRAAGVGYLTRTADWTDRPRHAKAGNLNNALLATDGEFLLVLDADQVPEPDILDRTLGWFEDPQVAFVQTPQWFGNVGAGDPVGSQAPLFYGPIQQGKDGWDAAFFCGSNAVLRREALMQLGVVGYVRDVERAIRLALRRAGTVVAEARRTRAGARCRRGRGDGRRRRRGSRRPGGPETPAIRSPMSRTASSRRSTPPVAASSRPISPRCAPTWRASSCWLAPWHGDRPGVVGRAGGGRPRTGGADRAEWSPLAALESVRRLVAAVDVDLGDEAQPVMPLATISVTEDMATAMRLHALGWRAVYHHEVLACGLAPEDLRSMLQQRLRWAQGTVQVALRENPLAQRG